MHRIKNVAVLGSGTMGMGIAAQFANIGCDVLLLDIVPPDLPEAKKQDGKARNAVADAALLKAANAKRLHPFYADEFVKRVTTGNLEDDLHRIAGCDWTVEVVVENLEIKRGLFARIEEYREPGTLITSNTSGIPIHLMAQGRSEDFRRHFCGTHFFNPVRFMRLLEIIPSEETLPEVVDFLMDYGDRMLGKQTVRCKDTPGFIANRIGFFSGQELAFLTEKYDLSIVEVDALIGPAINRPKTGNFRLRDLIGVDVSPKVAAGMVENLPNDPYAREVGKRPMPKFLKFLLDNHFLGDKTGQGFYKKTTSADGRRIIYALDLKTLEYELVKPAELPVLELAASIRPTDERLQAVVNAEDPGGRFLHEYFGKLFAYISHRIPEISDNVYSIDDAMRTGYGWNAGPFEEWDLIGLEKGVEMARHHGAEVANWVTEMLRSGHTFFYQTEGGRRKYYDVESRTYQPIPGTDSLVHLDNYRHQRPVFQNDECILHDIGDGVLCLEFTSRNNAIGAGIVAGMTESVRIAEAGNWRGLVIGNHGTNFTVGANLKLMREGMLAGEWEAMNEQGLAFQQANLALRYAKVPVVAAIQGYALGGGCEILLHCDSVVAAAEAYIGLVETGVGLLPGAGGTKEMALRAADAYRTDPLKMPILLEYFTNIATAAVSRSGYDAFRLHYLRSGQDEVVPNVQRVIGEAKRKVLELANTYVAPSPRHDIEVLGRAGLATLYGAINGYKLANYLSDYDAHIARKIAEVMCGGDLTGPQSVTETYLLQLEREAFMSLAGEPKTLERIEYMLQTGKPLKN